MRIRNETALVFQLVISRLRSESKIFSPKGGMWKGLKRASEIVKEVEELLSELKGVSDDRSETSAD